MERLLSRHKLIAMLVGMLLYGLLSWLTHIFPVSTVLGIGDSIDARPGVVIPIFLGLIFGPLVGFVTGFMGNFISDILTGRLGYPPDPVTGHLLLDVISGYNLNWQIGNGLMGFIPGFLCLFRKRFFSWRDQLYALTFATLGIIFGMGIAVFMEGLISDIGSTAAATELFIPVVKTNFLSMVILLPILLFNYARLDLKALDWLGSGIMRKFFITILISAGIPIILLIFILTQPIDSAFTASTALQVRLIFIIALALLFTVVNSALLTQNLTRPLFSLIEAVKLMEAGQLSQPQAAELKTIKTGDEIGLLIGAFGKMAQEVIGREQKLKDEIQQLHIEVDQIKRQETVQAVVETEFFQDLLSKVDDMRQKSQDRRTGGKAS